MMATPPVDRHEIQSSEARKSIADAAMPLRPPEHGLKCPRCDSPNTKFCYYNNYSLSQPRHFCKTCRRYWTKGGALRNVPVGGGCRKNKKSKSSCSASSSSSSSCRLSSDTKNPISSTAEASGGLHFFHGLSLSPAPLDFDLSGIPFSRLHSTDACGPLFNHNHSNSTANNNSNNQFFSTEAGGGGGGGGGTTAASHLVGFNYPIPVVGMFNDMGGGGASGSTAAAAAAVNNTNAHDTLASSIESLSSLNQDLHWKLQQQRLAMFFGGDNHHKESSFGTPLATPLVENQQQQLISSRLPDSVLGGGSRKAYVGDHNNSATEWYFENSSYARPTSNGSDASNNNAAAAGGAAGNNWNGIQTWNDMHHQFSALP